MLKAVVRACLSFGTTFYTVSQIASMTGFDRQSARHRLWKLEAAGLITRFADREIPLEGKGRPVKEIVYRNTTRLTAKHHALPKIKANGWDRMWQAARVLRRFTRNDLVVICEQGMENVTAFTKEYRKLGYLRCLGRAGVRNSMWILAKDAGPKRPAVTETADVD